MSRKKAPAPKPKPVIVPGPYYFAAAQVVGEGIQEPDYGPDLRILLNIAKAEDPTGTYLLLDLRRMDTLGGPFAGIWASGCLYHLNKPEFARCIRQCHRLLTPEGILYLNMKEGQGERFETGPLPGSPGGELAARVLAGRRFYAYYTRDELLSHFGGFDLVREDRITVARGGFEFWLRKSVEE